MTVPESVPAPKKRNRLLFIAAALVLICIVCGVIASLGGDDEPDTQPAAPQSEPAESESVPANTPLPASEPTDTPSPAGIPLEVQAYGAEVAEHGGAIGEGLANIGRLMQDAKLDDQTWTLEMATHLASIQIGHKRLTEIENVPPEMAEVHSTITDATADCDQMTRHLTVAIDNTDTEELSLAATLMQSCATGIQDAADLVDEYTSQFK